MKKLRITFLAKDQEPARYDFNHVPEAVIDLLALSKEYNGKVFDDWASARIMENVKKLNEWLMTPYQQIEEEADWLDVMEIIRLSFLGKVGWTARAELI